MTALCLCVVRKMSSASPARACPRLLLPCPSIPFVPVLCPLVFTLFASVQVWEDVYAGTTQEWSLRLHVRQHVETHQVLTHSKN